MSAWILLRGLAREQRHWARLPDRLRAGGLIDEIICVDLPGSGQFVGRGQCSGPSSFAPEFDDRADGDVKRSVGLFRQGEGARYYGLQVAADSHGLPRPCRATQLHQLTVRIVIAHDTV